jgi:hypothetical protein
MKWSGLSYASGHSEFLGSHTCYGDGIVIGIGLEAWGAETSQQLPAG